MINTIVWVMVSITHNGIPVPSLEFNTQEKCEKATLSIYNVANEKMRFMKINNSSFCVKIEK